MSIHPEVKLGREVTQEHLSLTLQIVLPVSGCEPILILFPAQFIILFHTSLSFSRCSILPLEHHRFNSPENVSPPALLDLIKKSLSHPLFPPRVPGVLGIRPEPFLSSTVSLSHLDAVGCVILGNDAVNFFKGADCQPQQLQEVVGCSRCHEDCNYCVFAHCFPSVL